jgi:adenylate kinase family enzyme
VHTGRRERFVVVGPGGAGKSTFALGLGRGLDLPVFDLDLLFRGSGSADSRMAVVERLVCEARWVIDGDHAATQAMRFAASDGVVFLDLPPAVCLWRLVQRAARNRGARRALGTAAQPLGGRWRTAAWVLRYPREHRPLVLRNLSRYAAGKEVFVARSAAASRRLLERLIAPASGSDRPL